MCLVLRKLVGDIRFWIVLFAVLRLYGIANPPLEVSHSWRQTTVAMAARNFYEIDSNILFPRIDIGGDLTGITGMEFPLMNWLIYLFSLLFGFHEWFGRAINLLVTSLGCWYFFGLLKPRFGQQNAFCSTQPVLALESTFDKFSDRSDLICVNSGQDPTVVYFTHRKGWVATNEQLLHDDFREALRQHGCRYILVMKKVFGDDVDLPLPVTYVSDDYTIYSL